MLVSASASLETELLRGGVDWKASYHHQTASEMWHLMFNDGHAVWRVHCSMAWSALLVGLGLRMARLCAYGSLLGLLVLCFVMDE